jgi:hypothetical protein
MDNNRNGEPSNNRRDEFRTDASKLAKKHLSDPNHVITEEEMRNIRVGVASGPDAPTRQAVKDAEDRIADSKSDKEDDTLPGGQKLTPWDTLNP